MKKCPYCGEGYADDVERCAIDDELLVSSENRTEAPASIAPEPPPANVLTARQVRIFEVMLVCLIAVGGPLLNSTYSFFNPDDAHSYSNAFSWGLQSFKEISALGLVWYVLFRQNKSFSDLGFTWAPKDIGWGVVLIILGTSAFYVVFYAIHNIGLTATAYRATSTHIGLSLFGGGIFLTTILFQFINPFFEELIVRAYLMTEIKALTGSVNMAILASTLLQTSYHFYQGAPAAFGHGATFLIFSIFYARTNRIVPVILAHMYSDVGSTLMYWAKHH
jgi:membrane protease YdiL (CAAX protease family)